MGVVKFDNVFEVYAKYVSFQFFEAFNRVQAVAGPVTDIRAGAYIGMAADGGEDGVGMPVGIGSWMIVDGNLYAVDARQAVYAAPLGLDGFRGEIA